MDDLFEKINRLLERKEYDSILSTLAANKERVVASNDLSFFYYICQVESGSGFLFKKKCLLDIGTITEILDVYYTFRRLLQRTVLCEEVPPHALLEYMNNHAISADIFLWTIRTLTDDWKAALHRIQSGENTEQSYISGYHPRHVYRDIEIDFIICTNNEAEFEEAKYYIQRLWIPDGVSINILEIRDAKSMCDGYNEGMEASLADYKVYLHHDVRIIERDFVTKLIDIFLDDEGIGLVGMIGTKELPKDGVMWNIHRFGSVLETHVHETVLLQNYDNQDDVEAILCDGFLLATAVDIKWRSDIFDGWDFYDASICMEYLKKGYKIKIPYQDNPWCLHDCGFVDLGKYEQYRVKFMKEYLL